MLGHCFVFILNLFGGNIKIYLVLPIVEWCGTFEVYLFAACPCFCLDYDCVLTHFVSVLSEILVWTWVNLAGCVVDGEEFDNIIGVDDGKTILKVIITNLGLNYIETYSGYLE